MDRYVIPVLAFGVAILAATVIGTLAHQGLGMHRATIRMDALAAAAFIVVALASSGLKRSE